VFILPLALLLAACAGSGPRLIGSAPREASGGSAPEYAPRYAPAPANLLVVYNAALTLEVADTDAAARRAAQIAYDRGGYLVSSQSWFQNERKYSTLTLAVPVAQFETARRALLDLGRLVSETVSGDLRSTGGGINEWNTFSHITLQLRPAAVFVLPPIPDSGWSPGRTARQAFAVFASAFTFLLDLLIWVVVVVGPFVLMALGVRALLRRAHRP
jgi:hypothetical protein